MLTPQHWTTCGKALIPQRYSNWSTGWLRWRSVSTEQGVRDELLRLHRMAHTVINGANPSESSADDLWEVAAALIDEFRQMSDHCLEIAAALQPLADLQPDHDV